MAPKEWQLQRYLTYKRTHPLRTLPQAYAWGRKGVMGGWAFPHGRGTSVPHKDPLVKASRVSTDISCLLMRCHGSIFGLNSLIWHSHEVCGGTPRVSGSVCHVPPPEIGGVRVSRLLALATYRGTSLIRTASSLDPTVGLCLGPYGGPRGGAISYKRGTPVCSYHKANYDVRDRAGTPVPEEDSIRGGEEARSLRPPCSVTPTGVPRA